MTDNHGDRKQILNRIRKALKTPAPKLSHPKAENQLPVINANSDFREWLPLVGESWDEQAALFASNSEALKTEFIICENEQELMEKLKALQLECNWQKIASHKSTFTEKVLLDLALPVTFTDGGYEVANLENSDVGITECDALIAQTGTVLVTTQSAGGRALSVLPPHHVVLARREQLLPDLTAAYTLLHQRYEKNFPTTISLITGPSRTGDIERILVLGAHGPKRLTIFCV
ncbi:MAG: LUD domain-containing protein [Abditibacteriaceae bacterium]